MSNEAQSSLSQRALLAIKDLRARLEATERARKEPIAITGIGCRFPAGVTDRETFWQLLHDSIDATTDIPAERWNVDAYYDPDPLAPGKMCVRRGAFLTGVADFDAHFFGIAPREAARIDPQQRLLLEIAWEALEDANISPDTLRESLTGVFVGITNNDYSLGNTAEDIDAYTGTGNFFSVAAGRISYFLGLYGPSLAVDTACSSSLVSVHLACQSLRSGECNLALAGGINLLLRPEPFIMSSKLQAISTDGRCKTFDASANGYARGEGCGMLVLKRLSDALLDQDSILAVIRGSAITHNGPGSGLTVPNGRAQQTAIRLALQNAELDATEVDYVETHGTGTALGDPIEMQALGASIGKERSAENPLLVGSVKTNIGHLESAAGIAGLIKTVLALQHAEIPPHLHLHAINPLISLSELHISIPTTLQPWPERNKQRIAGVSSFGINGTNAHMLLEAAPDPLPFEQGPLLQQVSLLPLSARSPQALTALARIYRDHFRTTPDTLANLCYTASVCRSHHEHRLALIGKTKAEIIEQLTDFLAHPEREKASMLQIPGRIAFVFGGQGTQWIGMGRKLFAQEPLFRQKFEACDQYLQYHTDWSLITELHADEKHARLSATEVAQPLIFALQVALAALWSSWGITPGGVIGHSVGEVAAAHIAGVLDLETAVRIVFYRGLLMQQAHGRGCMAMVGISVADARAFLEAQQSDAVIAAINSPSSVVLAGTESALDAVQQILQQKKIFWRKLNMQYAFHSPQMDGIQEQIADALQNIITHPAALPAFSTVTGQPTTAYDFTASYWRRNVREPVHFAQAIEAMIADGYHTFIEIGPHPDLNTAITQCLEEAGQSGLALSSLKRNQDDWQSLLDSLGTLYSMGHSINWNAVSKTEGQRVHLPAYPWQREHYWSGSIQPSTRADQRISQNNGTHSSADAEKTTEAAQSDATDQILQHYQTHWEPQAPGELATIPLEQSPGCWLLLCDQRGVGEHMRTYLEEQGETCISVHRGRGYRQVDQYQYQLSPDRREDFDQLIHDVYKQDAITCRGIIHLWCLDIPALQEPALHDLEEAQSLSCGVLLFVTQALLRQPRNGPPPRLWVLTAGVHPIDDAIQASALTQASIWGLSRTLTMEYPELWGGIIDSDPNAAPATVARQLLAELLAVTQEDQVAFRGDKRYVARLLQHNDTDSASPTDYALHPDYTYLITGGTGGLGLKIAQWMFQQGARHLVITGRSPLPPRSQWNTLSPSSPFVRQLTVLRNLEAAGACVEYVQADVSNEKEMTAVFHTLDQSAYPLKGIVHAAGVFTSQPTAELTLATLLQNVRPKALGGWVLLQLSRQRALDFLVFFSSASSVLGYKHMAPYAASNYMLDLLAHYGRANHLPALSINWGVWEQSERAPTDNELFLARIGMQLIQPQEAFTALEYLLAHKVTQMMVAHIDWNTFRPIYEARQERPFIQHIQTRSRPADQPRQPAFLLQLAAWPPGERIVMLEEHLQQTVSKVLDLPASQYIEKHRGFFESGMDSLMAIELKKYLETELECTFSSTLIFNYPTVTELTAYLAKNVLSLESVDEPAPDLSDAPQHQEQFMEIAALSEEEALGLLTEELTRRQI